MNLQKHIDNFLRIYEEQGKLTYPLITPYMSYKQFKKYFGSLSDFMATYSLDKSEAQSKQNVSLDDCIKEVRRLYSDHGKVTNVILKKYGSISGDTLKRRFGSLQDAYIAAGIPLGLGQRKFVSKEEILSELQRISDTFGYVSKPLVDKHSSSSPKIVSRLFGSFDQMYQETGFERSPSGYVPSDEELISDLHRLKEEYGIVTKDIISKYGSFSTTCYSDRFGCINDAYTRAGLETRNPGDSVSATWTISKFSEFLNESPEFERRFDWLRNPKSGYQLPVDAYYPKNNIVIEYNGPQHYELDTRYTRTQADLEYRQWLDSVKYEMIQNQGIDLIVIHYMDRITPSYITSKLGIEG